MRRKFKVMFRYRNAVLVALAVGIFFSPLSPIKAAVIKARSVSESDVSAAIESAGEGDTVAVPPGTASWTGTLTMTKPITLEGAGIGKTIIEDDLATNGNNVVITTASGKFYRVTGFEFRQGNRTAAFTKGCVLINGVSKTFRIDHCKFDRIRNRSIFTRNAVCGVIDHCVFVPAGGGSITMFHDAWDGKSWGDGSWATPIDWGGANAIYIEDNEFNEDPPTRRGMLDAYAGARFVFRYNKVSNASIASHGTGSTGRNRGVRHWEIYNNTFVSNPATLRNAIHMRGGTGVVFNNTSTGFGKFLTLHTYRYSQSFRFWPGSDATCEWDKNDPKVYASGAAGPGSGIGPDGEGGKLVVPGAQWSTNQWVGYTIRDLDGLSNGQSSDKGTGQESRRKASRQKRDRQPSTIKGAGRGFGRKALRGKGNRQPSIDEDAYPETDSKGPHEKSEAQSSGGRGVGPGPFFSIVVSNTADTIIVKGGSKQTTKIFAPGDRFEIRKVIQGLDMIGASTGELLSGKNPAPKWLNQTVEPVYVWNNTKEGAENGGVATAESSIKEGVHFLNNKSKPNYKPFVYPHPLVTGGATTH